MKKNKKAITIALVLSLTATFSALANNQCSMSAQLKCMMGMNEYCRVFCEEK
ncbi:hypothetical protein [uncultured Psychrosphaera sp.]|jgi:hypothetical protein|uniref:hypothetical protein n=1 Tax=uncultured Psychrosphaera sp. TaxID=1403522 RepID=UPI002631BDCB|nr:hypothetical protein [uncultured Psychrosphaera sp.]